jgi:uncharacterized membrane protein YqjE
MVEIAATVFVLVVAHIYIRAYIGMELFISIVGILFLGLIALVLTFVFPIQAAMVGGVALFAVLYAIGGGRNNNPSGKDAERMLADMREQWWRKRNLGKRIV